MRLVDADAFCAEIKNREDECTKWMYETEDNDIRKRAESEMAAFIECKLTLETMPTVEERKKGKWKKAYADHEAFGVRPFFRYCSACNAITVHPYNYCPNCGADMKGD